MSFLVAAALALSALVALPGVAHLFRRGRARPLPFPPAALVPSARTLARRERRLEDKLLLLVRALAIVVLAVIGATPLVQCSRLSLSRGSGSSLAVGLVLDDSLSMRARLPDGATRWQRAHDAARDLLASAREGDSVAIVLAGKPARVVLGATTDLSLARRVLDELRPSDRGTDLAGGVALARSIVADGGERPRRIVLLSDHASEPLAAGTPPPWTPLPELARAVADCGIVSAERHGARVVASLACNRADAARGRRVEVTAAAGSGVAASAESRRAPVDERTAAGATLAQAPLDARAGLQSVTLDVTAKEPLLAVRLTGEDALAHDDVAPVSPDESALGVAVVADSARSGVVTGGATPLEQALAALDAELALRPLSLLPEESAELDKFGLVILDDPRGLGPEARAGLTGFVERGGLALALLGPSVESVEIGATLEPFAFGAARWERKPAATGAKPASLGWVGPEAASLSELAPEGRVLLDPGRLRDARVVGEFSDGAPFVIERKLGRGTAVTVTLPSSPAQSDFALRPGFVALLDHFVTEAKQRVGVRRSLVGATWAFGNGRPSVQGPEGPLELTDASNQGRSATPPLRGFYRVAESGREELRTATLEPDEITAEPRPPVAEKMADTVREGARGVDVSNEFGWALVGLLGIELALRVARMIRGGGFRAAPAP
jgi:Mg-chelatase subunit ChlD